VKDVVLLSLVCVCLPVEQCHSLEGSTDSRIQTKMVPLSGFHIMSAAASHSRRAATAAAAQDHQQQKNRCQTGSHDEKCQEAPVLKRTAVGVWIILRIGWLEAESAKDQQENACRDCGKNENEAKGLQARMMVVVMPFQPHDDNGPLRLKQYLSFSLDQSRW
jgi:hypothetical protein